MLDKLTSEDFSAHIHESFRIKPEGGDNGATYGPGVAELIEVNELSTPQNRPEKRTPFSLIFRCSNEVIMPQQIYLVEHAQLGPLMMFLVPVGQDQEGYLYEAIFT